ncbi:hypothetical protein RISK_002684 [Rhodopirellula islandica]|uniref:Uncharacterized protein n=1 Tax=Rhodopirellula islandica TaxID=595434 RepID=A0A0J1BFN2_RHOIS|nr:hypothetical protein RISK_002684 [Rhodopirellula islandica]
MAVRPGCFSPNRQSRRSRHRDVGKTFDCTASPKLLVPVPETLDEFRDTRHENGVPWNVD